MHHFVSQNPTLSLKMRIYSYCRGSGHSMTQIIIGRVVGGAGGAGMVSLVSILISGSSISKFSECSTSQWTLLTESVKILFL